MNSTHTQELLRLAQAAAETFNDLASLLPRIEGRTHNDSLALAGCAQSCSIAHAALSKLAHQINVEQQ